MSNAEAMCSAQMRYSEGRGPGSTNLLKHFALLSLLCGWGVRAHHPGSGHGAPDEGASPGYCAKALRCDTHHSHAGLTAGIIADASMAMHVFAGEPLRASIGNPALAQNLRDESGAQDNRRGSEDQNPVPSTAKALRSWLLLGVQTTTQNFCRLPSYKLHPC